MVDEFLQRNKNETKLRQDNNKTINDRIKSIDENTKMYEYNKANFC